MFVEVVIRWVRWLACGLGAVVAVVLLRRGFLIPGALVVGLCVAFYPYRSRRMAAIRRFQADWASQGKDLILVYSDSPHWRTYVESTWLPQWGHRAVVLNWSERRSWAGRQSSELELFRLLGGTREFNPLAIVVRPSGEVHVVRFWNAFNAHKRGKHDALAATERRLANHLRDESIG